MVWHDVRTAFDLIREEAQAAADSFLTKRNCGLSYSVAFALPSNHTESIG
jgi:hypothetical protein